MNIQEQDHREVSEAQDHITWMKDQSNNTILYVMSELKDELVKRRKAHEKAEREQARKAHEINAKNQRSYEVTHYTNR